jgi:hypothetical protein
MGEKRLEVAVPAATSYDVVPGFGKSAATAFNAPRGNEEHRSCNNP